jgi:adenine-specific DNA-methyltransferase
VAENIDRLRALFPELITEGPNGAAVNVDVLKALVGDHSLTDSDEKYGLNWHGKRRARQLALTPSTGTLRLGRVGMWRGDCKLGLSVAAPFVWRCLTS